MEATPKIHMHGRHRQAHLRHRRSEILPLQSNPEKKEDAAIALPPAEAKTQTARGSLEKDTCPSNSDGGVDEPIKRPRKKITKSQSPTQTVLLVNGVEPATQQADTQATTKQEMDTENTVNSESPNQQQTKTSSSRNSSGDALSLRETLQQLPATMATHHHRYRRNQSPQTTEILDSSFHRGILGYMDRELKLSSPTPSPSGPGHMRKLQSLSDPQASPAQRSTRSVSRSSLDKSPRRKRSKSESRRRRERKLIAAGEMEVRQANETLMRYLKQCSEINDASLSGELEIDHQYDERRVHRKTKSQRDKRGHLINKLYTSAGLSSILKELSDDVAPADGEEIYNPFTPVVSPTDDMPNHIDKMFLQTSSGYRPVERSYYKHSFMGGSYVGGTGSIRGDDAGTHMTNGGGGGGGGSGCLNDRDAYAGAHHLLESSSTGSNIQLACIVHRIWHLFSSMCHGLLAGLALTHLLCVFSSQTLNWQTNYPENAKVDQKTNALDTMNATMQLTAAKLASFAEIYQSTFYSLAILCLISVFDRTDISRWHFPGATELISFRWLIIVMIYITTIILTISSTLIDGQLYYSNINSNLTLTNTLNNNNVRNLWSSLAVTRSFCAIGGWMLISATPEKDLLYDHLLDLFRYQLLNN